MKGTEILDKMIQAIPEDVKNDTDLIIYVSPDIYTNLVCELRRNVNTYKGFKVRYNDFLKVDSACIRKKVSNKNPKLYISKNDKVSLNDK